MTNNRVEMHADRVVKTGDPALMRVEVEKTRRAFEIAQACQLFRVPKVLDYDESKGIVILERIDQLRSIADSGAFKADCWRLLETIAASLAIVHKELTLPDDMAVPLPTEFAWSGTGVFLHGDMSLSNICIGTDDPPVVILDWQMTRLFGGRATFGTPYYDVMCFVNNLFRQPVHTRLLCEPVATRARFFLERYFREIGVEPFLEEFIAYVRQFVAAILRHRKRNSSWKNRILLAPGNAQFRRFVASLT